ncbi:type VII secretion-associated protein, partial [Mycobacterium sp. ITM-2017-0098]
TDAASRLLVDGRIAVRVPASWTVERITSGSGSARVRVSAPGGAPALHITQSAGSAVATIAAVADTLRRAIDAEPAGVFVDFDPSA